MASNGYLPSIGTPPSMSMPRLENVCNGFDSGDRPADLESGAGLDRVKTRRFAPALPGAFGGLDSVSRGAVLALIAGRMGPGHHINARATQSGDAVNARKAARDARAERIDRDATSIDGVEHRVRLTDVMADCFRDGKGHRQLCCANSVRWRSGASNDGSRRAAGSASQPFSDTRAAHLL